MSPFKVICSLVLGASISLAALSVAGSDDAGARSRCGLISQAPRSATDHQLRTSVLCLVNRARERRGIHSLEFSRELRRSATAHSKNMVRSGSFSHYGPKGSTLTTRVSHSGYLARAASYRLAENIAVGRGRSHGSPVAIVRMWMRSPGHRKNILDRGLHDFGVGLARGGFLGGGSNAVAYTLDFGVRRRP